MLEGNAPYDCEELRDLGATDEAIADCTPAPVFLADDLNHFWRTELGADFPTLARSPTDDVDGFGCSDGVRLGERRAALPVAERRRLRRARRARPLPRRSATSRSATSTGSPGPNASRSSRAARCRASSGHCSTTATPAPGCATSRPTIDRTTGRTGDRDGDGSRRHPITQLARRPRRGDPDGDPVRRRRRQRQPGRQPVREDRELPRRRARRARRLQRRFGV